MKKKPKRPPIKFSLSERLEGESIEDWIKRDTESLVKDRADCKEMRELIIQMSNERADLGLEYRDCYNNLQTLKKEHRKQLKELREQQQKEVAKFNREVVTPAKKKHTNAIRDHKKQLAKYNTLHNRYFTAVKNKVMQNMRSICGIEHTWADPHKKREIRDADVKKHKRADKKLIDRIEGKL